MSNNGNSVLAAERLGKIRKLLRLRRVMRIDDLCSELGVSPATVRRDLAELDTLGHVRRVHGGAVSMEGNLDEPVFDDKAEIAAKEKQKIAEAAIKHIKTGDSVFLDAGSTVLALARLLVGMNQLTVVTNSLRVASTLAGNGPRLILVGGEFRRLSQSFIGPLTGPMIERLNVNTAFMGATGLSAGRGLTTTDAGEALTKELVMTIAKRVILMAHSNKIETVSFAKFGELEDVDILITDSRAGAAMVRKFKERGMKVIIV